MKTTAISLSLALVLWAAPTRADDASEAQLQFEFGADLYRQGRYADALERFLASNRLVENPGVMLNIAQCYSLLSRPVEAYNWYEAFLVGHADDERAEQARNQQTALLAQVAVVDVRTTPPDAELFVGRVELGSVGRSPRRVAVEPGPRRIIARIPGYREVVSELTAEQGQVATLEVELEPLVGTLQVDSDPPGAEIHLEGSSEPLGVTPLRASVPVGERRVIATLEGHVREEALATIREGETSRVTLRLAALSGRSSGLTIRGQPSGARVTLSGEAAGETPLNLDDIAPGTHRIELTLDGHQPWSSSVVVEPDRITRIEYDLASTSAPTRRRIVRVMTYGGGAATLALGLTFAVLARVGRTDFFDSPSRGQLDRVERRNLTADLLMAAGVGALGTMVMVDLFHPVPSSTADVTLGN